MGIATNYNMSLGLQQNLGWGVVLDTGYLEYLERVFNRLQGVFYRAPQAQPDSSKSEFQRL
jgi:hypothetical protein